MDTLDYPVVCLHDSITEGNTFQSYVYLLDTKTTMCYHGSMIVCICKGITESTIREMLTYTDLEGIKEMTGACTQCQTCCQTLEEIASEQEEG